MNISREQGLLARLKRLAREMARMSTASEMDDAEGAGEGEAMSGDDACATLSCLIVEARQILRESEE